MDARSYRVGNSLIALIFGDITASQAEIVVSSDDYLLTMGGGVSAAISRAAGPHFAGDARKLTPARLADVLVSTAGELPAKYVLHAVTLGPSQVDLAPGAVVRMATQRALRLATALGCSSIAFPSIGSGTAGIAHEVVASEMAGALVDYLLGAERPLRVELYLMEHHRPRGAGGFFPFFEAFAARTRGLEVTAGPEGAVLGPPQADVACLPAGAALGEARLRKVYEMLRHLDARRDQLEAALLRALSGEEFETGKTVSQLRAQLEEVAVLRRNYEAELGSAAAPAAPAAADSVFVSSTALDLQAHRQAVRSTIEGLHLRFVGMEEFTPTATAPADLIRAKVESAKVYLGIIGMRYGSVDPASGFSMTELEYRQALASGKPLCMFVMGKDAPLTVGMVEDDPERFAKLWEFRGRVLAAHVCVVFDSVEELAHRAEAGLRDVFKL